MSGRSKRTLGKQPRESWLVLAPWFRVESNSLAGMSLHGRYHEWGEVGRMAGDPDGGPIRCQRDTAWDLDLGSELSDDRQGVAKAEWAQVL